MNTFLVAAFYKFTLIKAEDLQELRNRIYDLGGSNIRGLLLLGTEGINATIAGPQQDISEFKKKLVSIPQIGALEFKDSVSHFQPFRRWSVKIREEIVTLGVVEPELNSNDYLTAAEWHAAISDGNATVIDTRNFYETGLGKFHGAVDPNISKFSDFPKFLDSSALPKDKRYLIYCTGGIRCEKAILEMQRKGFSDVKQLQGGILKYLEEYPDGHFEGECFVFDNRVAVDANLKPTQRYRLCPHCGNPGETRISCAKCSKPAIICESCKDLEFKDTCSKNCAHHMERKAGRERLSNY